MSMVERIRNKVVRAEKELNGYGALKNALAKVGSNFDVNTLKKAGAGRLTKKMAELEDGLDRVFSSVISRDDDLEDARRILKGIGEHRLEITWKVRHWMETESRRKTRKPDDLTFPFDRSNTEKVAICARDHWRTENLVDVKEHLQFEWDSEEHNSPVRRDDPKSPFNTLKRIAIADGKDAPWPGYYYRIRGIEWPVAARNGATKVTFKVSDGYYSDYVNQCEKYLWDLARAYTADRSIDEEVLRKVAQEHWVAERDKFTRRSMPLGCNCLCVVARDGGLEPYFYLRARANNAEAMNVAHVAPAGTHQPWGDLDRDDELQVINTLIRETFEEILLVEGLMEELKKSKAQFAAVEDLYENLGLKDVYRDLHAQRGAKFFFVGMGFDLVTTKLEGLFVIVIRDSLLKDAVGAATKRYGRERLRGGEGRLYTRLFRKEEMQKLLESGKFVDIGSEVELPMLPAGAACLSQAIELFSEIKEVCKELVDQPYGVR